ncbi:MAG: transketolase [Candidatus Glassbacteria bacterium]|nr:transketolase [Candidatus Glassbacteria bacterium]
MDKQKIEQLAVDTLKILAAEAVQKANSGHPGMPMGMADAAFVLWSKFLRFDPRHPDWIDRDRFVLSAGHGSMLLYALLHLAGFDMSLEDLKNFRQLGSKTPGHPEVNVARGIETTTGPLGQGFTNGVGMAIARRFMASKFNTDEYRIYGHKVYAICSDGDLMEGISSEAASLAGHLGLGEITFLYDSNHITIEGNTDLAFDSEDALKRFEAYGWHTLEVDGHDRGAVEQTIRAANAVTDRPSLIQCNTTIGAGSPNMCNTAEIHGAPMGEEELAATKKAIGWEFEDWFHVPQEVSDLFATRRQELAADYDNWERNFQAWQNKYPELAGLWSRFYNPQIPADLTDRLLATAGDKPVATRSSASKAEQVIAEVFPNFLGGSADLAPSTKTLISGEDDHSRSCPSGRNFHFGVREHAMGGILNGMALYGGLKVFGATFFVFSDYMRPSIRLAAINEAAVTYVFTHDSIFVGEDGPTHQPVEQAMALRVIPNVIVLRPADATESAVAWEFAVTHEGGPVALLLTRHNIPVLDRTKYADARGLKKGAYVLSEAAGGEPEAVIIATGSEVHLALEAQGTLADEGRRVRVVSMPSWELFDAQDDAYRNSVLPPSLRKRLVVEAGQTIGWERYAGDEGEILGMDGFGTSGPWQELAEKYGFTARNIADRVRALLG